MTTKNLIVKIQNLVVNRELQPVKSNPSFFKFINICVSLGVLKYVWNVFVT